jgi:hypothetical protein
LWWQAGRAGFFGKDYSKRIRKTRTAMIISLFVDTDVIQVRYAQIQRQKTRDHMAGEVGVAGRSDGFLGSG